MVMQRVVKPKTQRSRRYLEHKEPKVYENTKQTMFIKGGNVSQTVTQALKELRMLKKTDSVMYSRKNMLRPFEDATTIEFFSVKADASLFLFGSHNKKRPNNIVIGRLFDFHLLDMVELGILEFKSMTEFPAEKIASSTKPCILLSGELFEQDENYKRLGNIFVDFFRGHVVKNIRLSGLEHVISISAVSGKIYLRSYRIILKKSGTKLPRVELEEIGPSLDMEVRRTKLASTDLYKKACRLPKTAKPKKRKNVSMDPFGTKHGKIHMQPQNIDKLQLRKSKALKKRKNEETGKSGDASPKKQKQSSEDGDV